MTLSGRFVVLIDGIRHRNTLRVLRKQSNQCRVAVVYVQTAADLAYRCFYSERMGGNIGIQEFYELREAPVEREVTSLISGADVLYNWEDRPTYQKKWFANLCETQALGQKRNIMNGGYDDGYRECACFFGVVAPEAL
ncbi:MAG: hypothetical protein U1F77_04720 [Kiritimatiellia bacterium]